MDIVSSSPLRSKCSICLDYCLTFGENESPDRVAQWVEPIWEEVMMTGGLM